LRWLRSPSNCCAAWLSALKDELLDAAPKQGVGGSSWNPPKASLLNHPER
jgi:hypothetical protein